MKALVITPLPPVRSESVLTGTHIRFSMFMEAIRSIVDSVEILHLVEPDIILQCEGSNILNRLQSEYWGLPVLTHLVSRHYPPGKPKNFVNHYLSGILSIQYQEEFYKFASAQQRAKVEELLSRSPDLVFVHRLHAMLPVLLSWRPAVRMFFDLDDIEHRVRFRTVLSPPIWPGKLIYLSHIPALAAAEWKGAAISQRTFVCSEPDRRHLARLQFPRLTVVPNALPVPESPPALPDKPTILFLGICHYKPNADAAERLVERIFPRIRAAIPDTQLFIAGDGSLDLRSRLQNPKGVQYLGFVHDLRALYAKARVICTPITAGGGTRLKLIEAAAYARPIVATRVAAEGLNFRNGIEILLREADDQIAVACIRLLQDPSLCRALGAAARQRMRINYDNAAIKRMIAHVISDGRTPLSKTS